MSEKLFTPTIGDLIFTIKPEGDVHSSWWVLVTEKPTWVPGAAGGWYVNCGIVDGVYVKNCDRATCIELPSWTTKWARVVIRRGVLVAWGGNLDLVESHFGHRDILDPPAV